MPKGDRGIPPKRRLPLFLLEKFSPKGEKVVDLFSPFGKVLLKGKGKSPTRYYHLITALLGEFEMATEQTQSKINVIYGFTKDDLTPEERKFAVKCLADREHEDIETLEEAIDSLDRAINDLQAIQGRIRNHIESQARTNGPRANALWEAANHVRATINMMAHSLSNRVHELHKD